MINDIHIIFFILLPIVAFLYAAVGHGGASGYLALMALFNFSPAIMRPTALLLNILVSAIAFYYYYKIGNFRWQLFFYLVLFSIPAAFIGGMVELDAKIYKYLLGTFLILPVIKFSGILKSTNKPIIKFNKFTAMLLGTAIGFLSGLIGIGGGIILTPIIIMLSWVNMKEAAAISALFITVNSIAGLLGNATLNIQFNTLFILLVVLAFIGGILGAFIGSNKLNATVLKRVLAFVLAIASVKLFFV